LASAEALSAHPAAVCGSTLKIHFDLIDGFVQFRIKRRIQ